MFHPSYEKNIELLKKYLPQNEVSLIDYGCGNGILIDLLKQKGYKIKKYIGYEVSESALDVANKKYKEDNITFLPIDTNKLPSFKPNSVDLVILIGVFQYLTPKEIEHVLKESYRALKPNGILLSSCVTDHFYYKFTNLYRFILPNNYINRKSLLESAQSKKFKIAFAQERGLFLGPLFSHGIVLFFDAIDKIVFKNTGKLGPVGILFRKAFMPFMKLENAIPIDFGYTLFLVLHK